MNLVAVEKVGRYEILQTLGRGAMGVVYLARDPVINREVALKTLRVDLDDEIADEFRERFIREAQAAGRLNHRSIVTVHDVGEDQASGVVFIAMEYIKGRNLKEILATGHRFRPSEAAAIASQTAHALDYAHTMGVVHRDIKPANIILTEEGTVKITDFGVARLESSNLTVEGQFIGTPNYMSPEQITGRPVDGRSDLFSLGVVLYELLTLQRPFAASGIHEVTRKIVEQPCPIPSTLVPGLPAAFNPIVLRCLEKDPAKRFQHGRELSTVLTALSRSLASIEGADRPPMAAQQEVETRIAGPPEAQPTVLSSSAVTRLPRPRASMLSTAIDLWRKIPLPAFMTWEVNPNWFWRIIVPWAVVWFAIIGWLIPARDQGPYVAPSAGSTQMLRAVVLKMREARHLLAAGSVAEARGACQVVLDQAPASPAARRLMTEISYRVESQRTGAENQQRASQLVDEGRGLYGRGRYQEAAERFQNALALDPASDLAQDYLALAEERLRPAQDRPASTTPYRRETRSSQPAPAPARAAPQAQPTPGTARLTVFFDSPINAGTVVVTIDGESAAEIPFDFTRKGVLGIKRKGSGKVKRVLTAPAGRRTVGVQLSHAERGAIGDASFTERLGAGTDWTLRIDLPDPDAQPEFYLVQASGPMW